MTNVILDAERGTADIRAFDQFGYPIGYYCVNVYYETLDGPDGAPVPARLENGDIMCNLTGDVLCAHCAKDLTLNVDDGLIVALGINGEIDGTETCDHCGTALDDQ